MLYSLICSLGSGSIYWKDTFAPDISIPVTIQVPLIWWFMDLHTSAVSLRRSRQAPEMLWRYPISKTYLGGLGMQGVTNGMLLTPSVFKEEFMLELNLVSEAERVYDLYKPTAMLIVTPHWLKTQTV